MLLTAALLAVASSVLIGESRQRSQQSYVQRGRRLGTDRSSFRNLRVVAYYDESLMQELDTPASASLRQLVADAAGYWRDALSVDPVSDGLMLERFCSSVWSDGTCAGYQTQQRCGGTSASDPVIPTEHFQNHVYQAQYGVDTVLTGGNGVANADFVLYVTAVETENCASDTLAYAGMCHTDQNDRPIAGRANFCPSYLRSSTYADQFATAVHELAHALGFSSSSHAYFRNSTTGEPLTPRGADGEPFETTATCVSGQQEVVRLPSTQVLRFSEERGLRVAKLVTPRVLQVLLLLLLVLVLLVLVLLQQQQQQQLLQRYRRYRRCRRCRR
jgi:leishmanolysin-like peptidase